MKANSDLIDRIKEFFKRYPKIYYGIVWFLGPMLYRDKSYKIMAQSLPKNARIINLGSGPIKLMEGVIDLDIFPHKNVDLLGDVQALPFKDASISGVINIALLEHVKDTRIVINEIRRVLKPGGYVYTVTPFIFGFHASPNDFYRWTSEGLKMLFTGFQEVASGVHSGPTSGLLSILQEWLAMLFSFQNKYLYQALWVVFMVILSPFKILDYYLCRHPLGYKISGSIYYLCKKQ